MPKQGYILNNADDMRELIDENHALIEQRNAALALAERRAGEIARLQEEQARMRRQFRFIRQDAASPLRRQAPATTFDGIVELCDAALAAETPPASGDAGGTPRAITVAIGGVPRQIETAMLTVKQAAELGLFAVPKGDGDGDRHGD